MWSWQHSLVSMSTRAMKLLLASLLLLSSDAFAPGGFRPILSSSTTHPLYNNNNNNNPFALDELVLNSGDTSDENNEKAVKKMISQSNKGGGKTDTAMEEDEDEDDNMRMKRSSKEVNSNAIYRIQRSQSEELAAAATVRGGESGVARGAQPNEFSISQLSLTEISQFTQFSMQYLADFAAQLGCPVPVDVNEKVGNLMTGDMIYELLVAVNTLEPYDADSGYNSVTVEELAEELGVTVARVMRVLSREKATLAFGKDTSLHSSLVNKVFDVYEDEEFDEPKTQEQVDEEERAADEAADPHERDKARIIDILTG